MSESTPEIWRPVPGWENHMVSNQGRVARILKPVPDKRGYLNITLSRRKDALVRRKVHQLVAEAFHGPRPEGMEVCHGDDNPANNAADNLRYDTHRENELDVVRHGKHHHARKTHCPAGHEYTPENTYTTPDGRRSCRECKRLTYEETNRKAREKREARGLMPPHNTLKTHCPQGHPYDEENTYIIPSTGGRLCKICLRERGLARRARARELRSREARHDPDQA